MDKVYQFVVAHWAGLTFGMLYVFTALIATMPSPDDPRPLGLKIYTWMYDFLHLVSNKVAKRDPQLAQPTAPPKGQ